MVVKNPKYYIFLKSKSLKEGGNLPPFNFFFDGNKIFAGVSFSTGEPNHLFIIQSTVKYIILIPFKDKVNLVGLERFEI
jgi:hypothetical protein